MPYFDPKNNHRANGSRFSLELSDDTTGCVFLLLVLCMRGKVARPRSKMLAGENKTLTSRYK